MPRFNRHFQPYNWWSNTPQPGELEYLEGPPNQFMRARVVGRMPELAAPYGVGNVLRNDGQNAYKLFADRVR